MKKTFVTILTAVLLLGLVLSLCGCQKQDSIVGTWEGTLDFSKAFSQGVAEGDEAMGQYFNITGLNLTMRMTFRENGTFIMEIDEESAKAAFKGIEGQLTEGMSAYMESMLEGTGMSLEDALAASGTTLEEMVSMFLSDEVIEAMVSQMKSEANYKAVRGKLFTSENLDDAIDESEFQPYSISGGELRLLEGEDTEDDPFAGMYPLVLKKVN